MSQVLSVSRTKRRRMEAKTRRRARPRRNRRVVVPRDKLGFATSMTSTLRYVQRVEFTPSSSSTAVWTFKANGLYDPFANIGGHQPRGFDELMQLYETFTVTDSKIAVNYMFEGYSGPSKVNTTGKYIQASQQETNVPAAQACIVGVFRSRETYGAGIPVQEQMEKDRTTWAVLVPGNEGKIVSTKANMPQFFGKQDLVAAEGYSGTKTADPANELFYHVFCGRTSDDYPSDTTKVVAFVTVEFRATFTNPKPMAAS